MSVFYTSTIFLFQTKIRTHIFVQINSILNMIKLFGMNKSFTVGPLAGLVNRACDCEFELHIECTDYLKIFLKKNNKYKGRNGGREKGRKKEKFHSQCMS